MQNYNPQSMGVCKMGDLTLCFLGSVFLLIVLQGCSNRDSALELALTKKLIQHKTDNVMSIDLRTIFGTQWKKACLQGPYMLQTHFEKRVGENVHGFEVLDDDRFTLWVFYIDGHTSRVDIGNAVMFTVIEELAAHHCSSPIFISA